VVLADRALEILVRVFGPSRDDEIAKELVVDLEAGLCVEASVDVLLRRLGNGSICKQRYGYQRGGEPRQLAPPDIPSTGPMS
jgi:hypothetical protein